MSTPSSRGPGIRQIHRWTSCVFTLTVLANFIALATTGGEAPHWAITYAPLPPLLVLMLSGTYMFARPYFARRGPAVSP